MTRSQTLIPPVRAAEPAATTAAPGLAQRACACGGTPGPTGECAACRRKRNAKMGAKLRVNRPGDLYEREADRIANRVMGSPVAAAPVVATPLLQRSSDAGSSTTAPPEVDAAIAEPGQPLDRITRSGMETRFGHDFSHVRVHVGSRAEASAHAVQARAYTVGQDVVFSAGEYRPGTASGQRLLAHELTHVLQQAGNGVSLRVGHVARAPASFLQRTSVTVGSGCPGTESEINVAVADARRGITGIADADARKCLLAELDDASIECESGDVCGSTRYVGSTIKIHQWGSGCPSLPALLVHEAAHKCKLFFSEEFAEACENEAFGGNGATPAEPGEEGGTCEL